MAILARINDQIARRVHGLKQKFNKGEIVTISKYLDARLISFLDVAKRDDVIDHLVSILDRANQLPDRDTFYNAILEREKIVSTGIGLGVAIPHAKLNHCAHFFIAIGIQRDQGIEWNALDGGAVRLVFLIGGPENRQTEYLKILSQLTIAIKNEDRRNKLLKAKTPQEVIDLFRGC